jgi:hypothetical protein
MDPAILKQDVFGRVEVVARGGDHAICRVACGSGAPGSAGVARWLAAREQRILAHLVHARVPGVPRPLGQEPPEHFYRSYIAGVPLYEGQALDEAYWEALLRLVQSIHDAGVTHNDLAKEANILVATGGEPAVVDFQIATQFRLRHRPVARRVFSMLCHEDMRHVLKQKLLHRPDLVSDGEREILARKSLPVRVWSATLMKPYQRLVCRLGLEDSRGPASR